MIIEIRKYTLKPGYREAFINFFEATNRPALIQAGMMVFGPMRDTENTDVVHWLRAFEDEDQREKLKDQFYDGSIWIKDIEPVVMPMIEKYEASLCQTTDGFAGFSGTSDL